MYPENGKMKPNTPLVKKIVLGPWFPAVIKHKYVKNIKVHENKSQNPQNFPLVSPLYTWEESSLQIFCSKRHRALAICCASGLSQKRWVGISHLFNTHRIKSRRRPGWSLPPLEGTRPQCDGRFRGTCSTTPVRVWLGWPRRRSSSTLSHGARAMKHCDLRVVHLKFDECNRLPKNIKMFGAVFNPKSSIYTLTELNSNNNSSK